MIEEDELVIIAELDVLEPLIEFNKISIIRTMRDITRYRLVKKLDCRLDKTAVQYREMPKKNGIIKSIWRFVFHTYKKDVFDKKMFSIVRKFCFDLQKSYLTRNILKPVVRMVGRYDNFEYENESVISYQRSFGRWV